MDPSTGKVYCKYPFGLQGQNYYGKGTVAIIYDTAGLTGRAIWWTPVPENYTANIHLGFMAGCLLSCELFMSIWIITCLIVWV